MRQDDLLTVLECCPQCGGRVTAIRTEAGGFEFSCIGMAGDETPCGWTAKSERGTGRVTLVKRKSIA